MMSMISTWRPVASVHLVASICQQSFGRARSNDFHDDRGRFPRLRCDQTTSDQDPPHRRRRRGRAARPERVPADRVRSRVESSVAELLAESDDLIFDLEFGLARGSPRAPRPLGKPLETLQPRIGPSICRTSTCRRRSHDTRPARSTRVSNSNTDLHIHRDHLDWPSAHTDRPSSQVSAMSRDINRPRSPASRQHVQHVESDEVRGGCRSPPARNKTVRMAHRRFLEIAVRSPPGSHRADRTRTSDRVDRRTGDMAGFSIQARMATVVAAALVVSGVVMGTSPIPAQALTGTHGRRSTW